MSSLGKKKVTAEQAYIEAMIFMMFADGSADEYEKEQITDELARNRLEIVYFWNLSHAQHPLHTVPVRAT